MIINYRPVVLIATNIKNRKENDEERFFHYLFFSFANNKKQFDESLIPPKDSGICFCNFLNLSGSFVFMLII